MKSMDQIGAGGGAAASAGNHAQTVNLISAKLFFTLGGLWKID
jgi:hypothetical protein